MNDNRKNLNGSFIPVTFEKVIKITFIVFLFILAGVLSRTVAQEVGGLNVNDIYKFEGVECPEHYRLITYDEATVLKDNICEDLMNYYGIVRIEDGGDIVGPRYDNDFSCQIVRDSTFNAGDVGESFCTLSMLNDSNYRIYDITPKAMVAKVEKVDGNSCGSAKRLLTKKEAWDLKDGASGLCENVLWHYTIAELANGYEITGDSHGCKVLTLDTSHNVGESLCFNEPLLTLNQESIDFSNGYDNLGSVLPYFYVPKQDAVIDAEANDDSRHVWNGARGCSEITMTVYDEFGVEFPLTLCASRINSYNNRHVKMNDGFWAKETTYVKLIVKYNPEDNLDLVPGRYSNSDGLLVHVMNWRQQKNGMDAGLLSVVHVDIGTIDVAHTTSNNKRLAVASFEISQSGEPSQCMFLGDGDAAGNSTSMVVPRMSDCDSTNEQSQFYYDYKGNMYAFSGGQKFCLKTDNDGEIYQLEASATAEECELSDMNTTFHFEEVVASDGSKTKSLKTGYVNSQGFQQATLSGVSLNQLTLTEVNPTF